MNLTPASTKSSDFNCPYCGSYAAQKWHRVFIRKLNDNAVPTLVRREDLPALEKDLNLANASDPKFIRARMSFFASLASGRVMQQAHVNEGTTVEALNLSISVCHSCKGFSIWRHDHLLYPEQVPGARPSEDLPQEIREDYEEARLILNASPRGAAALLRLALQKLCGHLGESGKDINKDIGALVSKGLPEPIQQALDIVRVVGNEAVHPGELDVKDDRDTVMSLLRLIDVIVEDRITRPRQISEMYAGLPEAKLAGIQVRDSKTPKNTT